MWFTTSFKTLLSFDNGNPQCQILSTGWYASNALFDMTWGNCTKNRDLPEAQNTHKSMVKQHESNKNKMNLNKYHHL